MIRSPRTRARPRVKNGWRYRFYYLASKKRFKHYTFGSKTADISTPTDSRKCYTKTSGAVSVPAGVTYSKNGAAFVSTAGTLVAGDYVIVRFTSSDLYKTKLSKDITMPVGVLAFMVTTIVEPAPTVEYALNPDGSNMLNPDGSQVILPTT